MNRSGLGLCDPGMATDIAAIRWEGNASKQIILANENVAGAVLLQHSTRGTRLSLPEASRVLHAVSLLMHFHRLAFACPMEIMVIFFEIFPALLARVRRAPSTLFLRQ